MNAAQHRTDRREEYFQLMEIFVVTQLALPEGQMVIANPRLRTLSLLNLHLSLPLLTQAHFSVSEWSVLLVLLRTFPHDASYAELYAAISGHERSQNSNHVDAMRNDHIPHEAVRPIREIVSGVRLKVRPFGFGIRFDRDLGYRIVLQSASRRGERSMHS
jgi:hypothetical protein